VYAGQLRQLGDDFGVVYLDVEGERTLTANWSVAVTESANRYKAIDDAVDKAADELIEISRDIHAHPELNYQEHHAARVLTAALERHGFAVERGTGGIETAFRGTAEGNDGGPTIGILVEYDALPEIGHGCGHNLIAISTLGAGIAAKAALDSLPGRIVVLGTPAEEGGGGKVRMLEAGVFDEIDVSLSSHPKSNRTSVRTQWPLDASASLAMIGFRYAFHGQAAHAAIAPDSGVNALNAVIALFNGIDAMRQHLADDVRIHGVITDGGAAPNIVPAFAAANFMLRSRDGLYLQDVVVDRVRRIAEGAAAMTGARLEVEPFYPFYDSVRPNAAIASRIERHAQRLGMKMTAPDTGPGIWASTDFGNVSQAMPSFAMDFAVSEEPVPLHTLQMQQVAATDLAHANALLTAQSLAATACDLLSEPQLVADARAEFDERTIALNRATPPASATGN
jgi:amidohydrolase